LAAHLVGSHHGYGRPFYPVSLPGRPEQQLGEAGPARFRRLNAELGPWRLAHLEALVRLADWAASAVPKPVAAGAAESGSGDRPEVGSGPKRARLAKAQPLPGGRSSPRKEVVLSGLMGTNVADYCAAVGLLRALSLADASATLRWEGSGQLATVPVLDVPAGLAGGDGGQGGGRGVPLLERALECLADFAQAKDKVFKKDISGSKSWIDIDLFRDLAVRARPPEAAEAAEALRLAGSHWLSGWYCEWARQLKPRRVAACVAAIWSNGAGSVWGQIKLAVRVWKEAQKDPCSAKAELIRSVGEAMTKDFGDLHALRQDKYKVFGLDHGSGSFRAKAGRDVGYYPLLAAFAFFGCNGLYRPRSRWAATGARRKRRTVEVDIWLHRQALSFATLRQLALLEPDASWLGGGPAVLRSSQIVTSDRGSFFARAAPVPPGRR
jgi:hypothetical protein